jgi:hypothetical protein
MAVEGKVAKILGNNEIVINRGRNEGVRPGMLLEVFAPEGEGSGTPTPAKLWAPSRTSRRTPRSPR